MDFEILKAAMLASKSTMLKGDDVTTEKMPAKMLPGGGNNAKANEWSFLRVKDSLFLAIGQVSVSCLFSSLHFWPSCYPFLVYACKAEHICQGYT